MKQFVVNEKSAGQRADVFISSKFPEFSRSSLSGLFEHGNVNINQKPAKPGYKLRKNDSVGIDVELLNTLPDDIELPVLYEDEDVVVINKPAGVLTHSKGALNIEPTVASFISSKITDKKMTGNRAGIVHRLDRGTSGVMITAKNKHALNYLQKQFSNRKVKKTYLAIAEGVLDHANAVIDAPIARNPRKPQTFKVDASGKNAKTKYKVLEKKDNYSLLELEPETGRTHQIRVHLAYINHPVVGDTVYGRGGEQMLLHASKLELVLPNGKKHIFKAPTPTIIKNFKKHE